MSEQLNIFESRFSNRHHVQRGRVSLTTENQWVRAHGRIGGDLDGSFKLYEELPSLLDKFQAWLGFHVREEIEGGNFTGYIHALTLHHAGASMRRALEVTVMVNGRSRQLPMANAVAVAYGLLVENGAFEEEDIGMPVFAHWSETLVGADSVAQNYEDGEAYATLTRSGTGGASYIYQDIVVDGGRTYQVKVHSRGNGANGIRIEAIDSDTNTAIALKELNITSSWKYDELEFYVASSVTDVTLRLYVPSAVGSADVRHVEVYQVDEFPLLTEWAVNQSSINQYGRREYIPPVEKKMSYTQAVAYRDSLLTDMAWPSWGNLESSSEQTALEVEVVGYMSTLFHKYNSERRYNILLHNALTVLLEQCDWLTDATIRPVNQQTIELVPISQGDYHTIGEWVRTIVDMATGSQTGKWRLWVENGEEVVFEEISLTPELYESDGEFVNRTRQPVQTAKGGVLVEHLGWAFLTTHVGSEIGINQYVVNEFECEPLRGTITRR